LVACGQGGAEAAVLFDDEPSFVSQLTQGSGQASLETAAPFVGQACLVVTPPQRFNPRISSWNYSVVEQPALRGVQIFAPGVAD
jgi:hypothetical protein